MNKGDILIERGRGALTLSDGGATIAGEVR